MKRLQYLIDQFMTRKLKLSGPITGKGVYGGISDTHHSVMRLLLLLQNNSVSLTQSDIEQSGGSLLFPNEEVIDTKVRQVYISREERERIKYEKTIEDLQKAWTEEDIQIQRLKSEWELELGDQGKESEDSEDDWNFSEDEKADSD